MSEWYYARNNQRLGPVSMEQLKQLGATGQLGPNDLVWKDGMANWAPASSVPGLIGAAPPPPPPAPRPAAVAPAAAAGDVLDLPLGRTGGSPVDTALLLAKRMFEPDLGALPIADDERAELSAAGITGETGQRYLVWRRSLLWVSAVPLVFTGIALTIDSLLYTREHLTGVGLLLEIIRILTMLGLPAAAVLAALNWTKVDQSSKIAALALPVCYGLPMLILILPASWYSSVLSTPPIMMLSLFVVLLSFSPALLRACLRARTLLPESANIGLLTLAMAFMSAMVFFAFFFNGLINSLALVIGAVFAMLFGLLVVTAPKIYLLGHKTFVRPLASAEDRKSLVLWQWIYFGLCGAAAVVLIVGMIVSDAKFGVYGFWIALLLFLDFLGRSLFASVVAAQYVLSYSRAAYVAQQEATKTEQGSALDRRMSELEPIVGKM